MNRHSLLGYPYPLRTFCPKISLILVLFFFFFAENSFCQAPVIDWKKNLGGNNNDYLTASCPTIDGGFLLVGNSDSDPSGDLTLTRKGKTDVWVLKVDANGNIIWQKMFGGQDDDFICSVKESTDGSIILAGYTLSKDGAFSTNHGKKDIFLAKLGGDGSQKWLKCFGGSQDEVTSELGIAQDGYVVFGSTNSNDGDVVGNPPNEDIWAFKVDFNGNIQWQRIIGGNFKDISQAIKQTPDKGFIAAANIGTKSGSIQNEDILLTKIAPTGSNVQWQRTYGGGGIDVVASVENTPDGGFVMMGRTTSSNGTFTKNQGKSDLWVIKTNDKGGIEWTKTYGGSGDEVLISGMILGSAKPTEDGGYIVTASTNSKDGDVSVPAGWTTPEARVWVLKLDCKGNIIWQKIMGGNVGDFGNFIYQTSDKGFFTASVTQSNSGDVSGSKGQADFWLVKLKPESKLKLPLAVSGSLTFCEGKEVKFETTLPNIQYKFQWQKDGVDLPTETTQKYTAKTSGKYTLLATSRNCPKPILDTTLKVEVTPYPKIELGVDKTLCYDTISIGDNPVAGVTYLWSDGKNTSKTFPATSGKYVLKASQNGCETKDSLIITKETAPKINLPTSIEFCEGSGKSIFLDAGYGNGWQYDWQPYNLNSQSITVTQQGDYLVKVKDANNGCESKKAIKVFSNCIPKLYIPDIFTPNGDSQNDVFEIRYEEVTNFEISIFSRWGELLFHSKDITDYWNGTNLQELCMEGVYTYKIKFSGGSKPENILERTGSIFLKR
jgi:gliding motility-associated-like protein